MFTFQPTQHNVRHRRPRHLPKLGYWKIRSMVSPIRMAFAYAKVPFEEDLYTNADASRWKVDNYKRFVDEKIHPFPNLPYLVTPAGATYVQSNAILRHLGRAFDLYGDRSDEAAQTRIDELFEQLTDVRNESIVNYYCPEIKPEFITGTVPFYLEIISRYLQWSEEKGFRGNGPFFFGAKPTVVDFVSFEIFDVALQIPAVAEKRAEYEAAHPQIFAHLAAVKALPELAEYFAGEQYLTWGANGKSSCHMPSAW